MQETTIHIALIGLTGFTGYLTFKKTKNVWITIGVAVAVWYVLGRSQLFESFHDCSRLGYPRVLGYAPSRVNPIEEGGDLHLTNLYRKLHNLDAIQRSHVFQFNDAFAGGSYGIAAEPYIGAQVEREMSAIKHHIQHDIEANRRPYTGADELYGTPTKPVFMTMGLGDERILGIPSQVGTLPAYY